MRIISGTLRGRKVLLPKSSTARPTSDMVRESLFSILGARVKGCSFLDLFAGSGAVGIESLSRGAARAVFCDRDIKHTRAILDNLESFGIGKQCYDIFQDDFRRVLDRFAQQGEYFDIVFIDPPYASGFYRPALEKVFQIISDDGIAVLETDAKWNIGDELPGMEVFDQRKYGSTKLIFSRKVRV